MSKPDTIKIDIDGVEYVRKDSKKAETVSLDTKGDVKIVVLDRGFVYVGRASDEGEYLVLRNAKNIRVWGTSKGLGELVNGPTSNTILDDVGTVRAPKRALIHIIDVVESKWKGI